MCRPAAGTTGSAWMHARSTQRQQLRLQRAEHPRQPLGPRLLPCHIGNEVLADLQFHVHQPTAFAMHRHRVVAGAADRIRFVVPTTRSPSSRNACSKAWAKRVSWWYSTPACHGRCTPFIAGVKLCIITSRVGWPASRRASSSVSMRVWYGAWIASMRCCRCAADSPALPGTTVVAHLRNQRR